eukprot:CAMPEP_0178707950 /NCGR_PEP_ID=MMETSP0699-20121125/16353_1 /TAXON_ID=265572 /ORGANISM="Extubocellulus spinifer, Strain CCMP396" /LENGTH=43 /DNA_ID= /DNA_START= /DNA_END= /DNA_ORIENTATION=
MATASAYVRLFSWQGCARTATAIFLATALLLINISLAIIRSLV